MSENVPTGDIARSDASLPTEAALAAARPLAVLLDRRAWDRTVRAKHATVASLWFQARATTFAVIENLTCIYWHRL